MAADPDEVPTIFGRDHRAPESTKMALPILKKIAAAVNLGPTHQTINPDPAGRLPRQPVRGRQSSGAHAGVLPTTTRQTFSSLRGL